MIKFCPNCGKEVSTKFCPFCGFDISSAVTEEPAETPQAPENTEPAAPAEETPVISFEPEAPKAEESEPVISFEPQQAQPETVQGTGFDAQQAAPAQQPQQNYNAYSVPPAQQKEPLTKRTWFIILLLLIFWPLGLFFMWRGKKFSKVARIIITVVIGVLFIINILGLAALGKAANDYAYDDGYDYYSSDYDDYDDYSYDSGSSYTGGGQIIDGETAYECALGYLNVLNFSRDGLIDQLEYEGYSNSEATAAVDALTVDWNQQAAGCAQSYLNTFPEWDRAEMIDQLEYEGFTYSQAAYGADAVGL